MRAVTLKEYGGPEVLQVREIPPPRPGPGEVLVRVRATAVNRADLLQRQGLYPPPDSSGHEIPGLEFAGEVEALGEGAVGVGVGQRIMGLCAAGGYAEHVAVPFGQVMPIPEGWSMTDAAAVPEVFLTAYDALRRRLELEKGEAVLWHAVGSGLGTAGIQLSRLLGAGKVLGSSRTPEKLERARKLGLDVGLDSSDGSWAEAVKEATKGRGVDGIVDVLGGAGLAENVRACARGGRIVSLGLLAGRQGELDMGALLMKRIRLEGSTLRSRDRGDKAALVNAFWSDAGEALREGRIRPVVDKVLPLEKVQAAHKRLESNKTFGKVVLRV